MDVLDLNFKPRTSVQVTIRDRYGESINFSPTDDPKEFFLVVLVGHYKLRLSE
jgi:hypothetical protein